MTATHPLLEGTDLTAGYGLGPRAAPVLHDVSLSVNAGETLGIVGESGSGKSTLAKVLVGELRPSRGYVFVDGNEVTHLRGNARRSVRRFVQMIPQNPYASLNPRMTIGETLAEAIDPRRIRTKFHAGRIAQLLESVKLDPKVAHRLPHEFSGGQRQRVAIARALAIEPRVIVADEVTSALDASVQAEVLDVLKTLQRETGVAFIFVTHDLEIAAHMCNRITVLLEGRVVEAGPITLLKKPADPYTQLLINSVPDPAGRFLQQSSVNNLRSSS